jgi:WD40 repeat protein
MRRAGTIAAAFLSIACIALPAGAQQPDGADPLPGPFLSVETGTHLARIRQIVASADGSRAVTASPDRTIRVWDTVDGSLQRTFRLPLGTGDIGDPEVVEISSSGKSILAAARSFDLNGTGHDVSIYLLNVESGSILGRRQTGIDRAPRAMDFAEGNRWLALARGSLGLQVLKGNLADPDRPLIDRVEGEATVAAVFTTRDRIATATDGGTLRLLQVTQDAQLERLAEARAVAGGRPHRLAFSPDGRLLAVGYLDAGAVDVYDGISLRHLRTLAVPDGLEGNLATVAWLSAADATPWLAAAGSARSAGDRTMLLLWAGGQGRPLVRDIASDSVTSLSPAGPGALLYAAADASLGRIDLAGADAALRPRWQVLASRPDYRSMAEGSLRVSADGARVLVTTRDGATLGFDLARLERLGPETPAAGLRAASPARGDLSVTGWRGGREPAIDGRPLSRADGSLALAPGERTLAADVEPAAGRVILGADFGILLTLADGVEIGRIDTRLPVWGVALADRGRVAVAALGDGTIRWYGVDPGGRLAEKAAVFLHADGVRWVAWLPDGSFAHSREGGADLVGYQINGVRDSLTGQWVAFGALYDLYYSPPRVAGALAEAHGPLATGPVLGPILSRPQLVQLGYCARAATEVDWATRRTAEATRTLEEISREETPSCGQVDPVVLGLSRAPDGELGATLPAGLDALDLAVQLRDTGGGVSHIDAILDGRLVGRFPLSADELAQARGPDGLTMSLTVPLDPGALNRIALRAYNAAGVYREGEVLRFRTASPLEFAATSTLHVVAIGVDDYRGEGITPLEYAVHDAGTVAADIVRLAAPAYDEVAPLRALRNDEATRANILRLLAEVASQARQGDAVVIYLAGHAIAPSDRGYAFVTADVPSARVEDVYAKGLTAADLATALGDIVAGNMIVMLDTCYAGGFAVEAPDRLAHATGRYVLTATKGVEEALDHAEGTENGVFAHAVRTGLSGEAEVMGEVDALSLGAFVQRFVPVLAARAGSGHRQNAVFKTAAGELRAFPLAVVGN